MTDTATYDAPGHPTVTVERDDDELTVTVSGIDGLDPQRTPNDEETDFGIESLSPIKGSTDLGEQRLIDIAVRATHAAVESSVGLDVAGATVIAQKIGHSVRSALALLPPITTSTGIGTVYTPP